MLTAILERGSWVIAKVGMPLVYFYHLMIASIFFNTAAEDAKGLEKVANVALVPMQYFFEGKKAIPYKTDSGEFAYRLERSYNYDSRFFVKTASSAALLPFSLMIGGSLKGLSYLSPETRKRAKKIYAAAHARNVTSNLAYYASIGIDVEDYHTAQEIEEPKYKKHPDAKHRLGPDLETLKEITRILSEHNIPFWLDCGSCLGTYQYGGAIPHDWDIDIAILLPDFQNVKNALQELDPKLAIVQDWSGRARPESYLKVFVHESGGMIDIYHFAIDEEKQEVYTLLSNEYNIFLPKSWKIREERYCTPMPFSHVFPRKKALFEGIEVPVPGKIVEYLQTFYGENLAPARLYNELTGTYDKDETHPYWELPNAH